MHNQIGKQIGKIVIELTNICAIKEFKKSLNNHSLETKLNDRITGKLLRTSKYEEEISDGHLGINEKELNSMNKHIPGNFYP